MVCIFSSRKVTAPRPQRPRGRRLMPQGRALLEPDRYIMPHTVKRPSGAEMAQTRPGAVATARCQAE